MHRQTLFVLLFFTQYIGSLFFFTLFAILKKRKNNTQFQQATINLPPSLLKETKINIFANDRKVNVNSSYETQENRYSLPSYLAIIQKNQVKAHTKRT